MHYRFYPLIIISSSAFSQSLTSLFICVYWTFPQACGYNQLQFKTVLHCSFCFLFSEHSHKLGNLSQFSGGAQGRKENTLSISDSHQKVKSDEYFSRYRQILLKETEFLFCRKDLWKHSRHFEFTLKKWNYMKKNP